MRFLRVEVAWPIGKRQCLLQAVSSWDEMPHAGTSLPLWLVLKGVFAARCFALSLAALATFGCPHESDPDSPRLVGEYEAIDPTRVILGSKKLFITDAHHLRTDDGKVYEYSVSEEFFLLDVKGNDDLTYSPGYSGYPEGIMFEKMGGSKQMFYKRVR